jgi:hypothetical protein
MARDMATSIDSFLDMLGGKETVSRCITIFTRSLCPENSRSTIGEPRHRLASKQSFESTGVSNERVTTFMAGYRQHARTRQLLKNRHERPKGGRR